MVYSVKPCLKNPETKIHKQNRHLWNVLIKRVAAHDICRHANLPTPHVFIYTGLRLEVMVEQIKLKLHPQV